MTIQPHHLHTHGPDPMRPAGKPHKAQWKPEVHRFDLDDEATWPQVERDGEYVLVVFNEDIENYYEYPYEIKRTEFVPNYSGVVAWVRMTDFFKAIEKEVSKWQRIRTSGATRRASSPRRTAYRYGRHTAACVTWK